MENKIDNQGNLQCSPIRPRKRSRVSNVEQHELKTKPDKTGKWDEAKNDWTKVKTQYLKSPCSGCGFLCRTYCTCNKKVILCTNCWGGHKPQHNNTLF